MSITQQLVAPSQIESELLKIWSALAKADKTRACLFNLIVFNRLSERTDYVRSIVQSIADKFPCRVLFVSHDADPEKNYLKTAVSVVVSSQESSTACDHIDIGAAGTDWERVPYVILPHIVPDLPVYLLWTETPSGEHPLFNPLVKLATRVIFDSESADHLSEFASELLSVKEDKSRDIADLNWARLEGWRELLASTFEDPKKLQDLYEAKTLHITFNARTTEFFCHLKIQSIYLVFWLSSRLGWHLKEVRKKSSSLHLYFHSGLEVIVDSAVWENLGPGNIIATEMNTSSGAHYQFRRNPEISHHVTVQISTPSHCDLPYQFVLGKTARGQSLVQEVFHKGTSLFFIETLRRIKAFEQTDLC